MSSQQTAFAWTIEKNMLRLGFESTGVLEIRYSITKDPYSFDDITELVFDGDVPLYNDLTKLLIIKVRAKISLHQWRRAETESERFKWLENHQMALKEYEEEKALVRRTIRLRETGNHILREAAIAQARFHRDYGRRRR